MFPDSEVAKILRNAENKMFLLSFLRLCTLFQGRKVVASPSVVFLCDESFNMVTKDVQIYLMVKF